VTGAEQRVRLQPRLPAFAVGFCALVAVLVYLPTLGYQLVWDDGGIIVQSKAALFQSFAHSLWQGGEAGVTGDAPYYRPLSNFSLGVDELVAGHRAWYFHLVNLLLHAAAVALAGVVVWQVFGSVWCVLAAGMLCAVHPLAAGSVAYVSGRTDLLAGAGLLVALLGLLRLQKRPDWPATVLVWAGFAFAVFSKETAAMFAVVAGVWLLAPGSRRVDRQHWVALAGVFVLLGGYLAARYAVLGSVIGVEPVADFWAVALRSLNSFGRLLMDAILPSVQGAFRWTPAGFGRVTLSAIPTVLYLALPFLLRPMRRTREAGLAWLWGAALLLPFAGPAGFGPVGRLLYVPGIGFVLLALFVGRRMARGSRSRGIAAVVVAFCYCAVLALLVLPRQMRAWKDSYTLFRRMTAEAPEYAAAHSNFAFELRQHGDVDGAVAEYRKAIALDSGMALAYSNLGALLQSKGELAEAEFLYGRTIELRPHYALAWNNLAIIRYKRGDGAGAVAAFRRAIELKPDDGGAVYNLGRLYQQAGMADSAALMFERAYRLDPGNPQIRASYELTHGRCP